MSNQIIHIDLFDTQTQRIRKVKDHSIELTPEHIIFRANFLIDEKQDGIWKESLWRFWDEYYSKEYVSSFGMSRTKTEEDEDFFFTYRIAIDDDIILLFDSKEKCLAFHERFKKYMLSDIG